MRNTILLVLHFLLALFAVACQPQPSGQTTATDAPLVAPTDTPDVSAPVAALRPEEILVAVKPADEVIAAIAYDVASGESRTLVDDLRALAGDGGFLDLPARSPDGTRLAYERSVIVNTAGGFNTVNQGIWVSNIDGSGTRQIAAPTGTFEYTAPVWSTDGQQIAFRSNEFGGKAYVVSLDGTPPVELVAGTKPNRVSWSPDQTRLLYTSDRREGATLRRGIFVYDIATATETAVIVAEDVIFSTPAWSPDGTRITYIRWNSSAELQEVFVSNADGSDALNLTPGQAYAYDPQFSPDGTQLAYNHYDSEAKTYSLALLTLDGSAERQILFELRGNRSGPDW